MALWIVASIGMPTSAAADLEAAPGRVLFPVAGGRAQLVGASSLPEGGALLIGAVAGSGDVYVVKVSRTGALDPSFGAAGVARVNADLAFEQILLQNDGKVLLVGLHSRAGGQFPLVWDEPHPRLVVVRLNAAGSIDSTFGVNGTAATPLEGGCRCGRIAIERSDGTLVLTGQRASGDGRSFSWAVTRLSSAGTLDSSFGQQGISILPGTRGVGLSIAAAGGNAIVAQGQAQVSREDSYGPTNLMTRLTPDGTPDSSFAKGVPFELPVLAISDSSGQEPSPLEAIVEPDGTVIVETFPIPANPGRPKRGIGIGLLAYRTDGTIDKGFGYGGYVNLEEAREPLGSALMPAPDGGLLAIHRRGDTRPSQNPSSVRGTLEIERLTSEGLFDRGFAAPPGRSVTIPFGGGVGDPGPFSSVSYGEPAPSLDENSFLPLQPRQPLLLPQPDGSYLLAGSVSLTSPPGPRAHQQTVKRFALAAITPSFSLDPLFGGPARLPSLTIGAPRQHARTALAHRSIVLRSTLSAPGLVRVQILGRGRPLARRLIALLRPGGMRIAIPLTSYGARYLRSHPHTRLRAVAAARDMLAHTATKTVRFTLR